MKIKLYTVVTFVAVASGIVALVRIALGENVSEVVRPNIVIGSVCLVIMVILFYRQRRQFERRN